MVGAGARRSAPAPELLNYQTGDRTCGLDVPGARGVWSGQHRSCDAPVPRPINDKPGSIRRDSNREKLRPTAARAEQRQYGRRLVTRADCGGPNWIACNAYDAAGDNCSRITTGHIGVVAYVSGRQHAHATARLLRSHA